MAAGADAGDCALANGISANRKAAKTRWCFMKASPANVFENPMMFRQSTMRAIRQMPCSAGNKAVMERH
jgi:hypothetical protein